MVQARPGGVSQSDQSRGVLPAQYTSRRFGVPPSCRLQCPSSHDSGQGLHGGPDLRPFPQGAGLPDQGRRGPHGGVRRCQYDLSGGCGWLPLCGKSAFRGGSSGKNDSNDSTDSGDSDYSKERPGNRREKARQPSGGAVCRTGKKSAGHEDCGKACFPCREKLFRQCL